MVVTVCVCVCLCVCVSVGLNTGSYYAIGTLLNTIVLHYFPVRIYRYLACLLLYLSYCYHIPIIIIIIIITVIIIVVVCIFIFQRYLFTQRLQTINFFCFFKLFLKILTLQCIACVL